MSAPADPSALAAALTRVPDVPHWVDTRGMLESGRAEVWFAHSADTARDGFVVTMPDRALASVVGPAPGTLIEATIDQLAGDVNVLAHDDAGDTVASVLPGWRRQTAIIHALPGRMPWEREVDETTRIFYLDNAPPLDHVPERLRLELEAALKGRPTTRFVEGVVPTRQDADAGVLVPVAAAWHAGLPVSFCYPVLQTASLWDVSIDTLEEYRGLGLARRAARALVRQMRRLGKAPVWGALSSNHASLALARRLGFEEAGRLAVFDQGSSATAESAPG